MAELKRIPKSSASEALEKALRYRMLNEPLPAESICRDVLAVDPGNQEALVNLLLALTDQFDESFVTALDKVEEVLQQIRGEYERAYYEGIMHERWATAQLARNIPANFAADWYRRAMRCYEQAEKLSRPGDPDAILRWNRCARYLERHQVSDQPDVGMNYDVDSQFGDDVPLR